MGLCKPVMGAWSVTCAWASVSQFLPHDSATLQFQEEQIGTLFVWVGAPEGGVRGWVVGQGGPVGHACPIFFRTPPAEVLHLCIETIV